MKTPPQCLVAARQLSVSVSLDMEQATLLKSSMLVWYMWPD